MQAVILAGGKGTRLRPYTVSLPKPLVPVGDYPIIEILLRKLKRNGFNDIIISTGHLAELIEAYCRDGRRWGLRIRYAREDKPLNTAGALRLVRGLQERFLVVNGDVLTDMDFREMAKTHARSKALATVGVVARESRVDYGVVEAGPDSELVRYIEKPSLPYLVSMGVNALSREAVGHIRPGEALGMPDFLLRLKKHGPVRCFRCRGAWLDIGRPDDYQAAQDIFEKSPAHFLNA
jgi:NDP-sugar pyrophosphorylase family protein